MENVYLTANTCCIRCRTCVVYKANNHRRRCRCASGSLSLSRSHPYRQNIKIRFNCCALQSMDSIFRPPPRLFSMYYPKQMHEKTSFAFYDLRSISFEYIFRWIGNSIRRILSLFTVCPPPGPVLFHYPKCEWECVSIIDHNKTDKPTKEKRRRSKREKEKNPIPWVYLLSIFPDLKYNNEEIIHGPRVDSSAPKLASLLP